MHSLRRFFVAELTVAALGVLILAGCGKKEEADEGVSQKKSGKGAAKTAAAKVDGYAASIKGKVTYNGPEAAMKVNVLPPTKDQDKCPMQIQAEGWYVKDQSAKGVRYAVVFLKAPRGTRFPEAAKELEKPEKPELEIRQPRCQFEPRVLVMHPSQRLKVFNDSEPAIVHDANIGGPNELKKTMPPGSDTTFDVNPSNLEPNKMSCGIHQGTMSAHIWKFEHPYAAVTDENGNYELKHVPVISGGKLEVWVWHEMLQDANKMKKVGTVDVEVGKSGTLDIAIPN